MLSLSTVLKTLAARHPITLRCASGEAIALIGPKGAGKTTLLRLLAAQLPLDSGSIWMSVAPDPSRPFAQAHFEIGRNRSKWLRNTAFIPAALTAMQKFRYGTPAVMLAKTSAPQPALLLLDEPLQAGTLSGAAALQDLLTMRRKKGLMTIVSADDINDIALFDRVVILNAGKIHAIDTSQGFLKKMSSPMLAIRTQDMVRLERDLPDFEGGRCFYRFDGAIRLQLYDKAFNTANAGIAIMSLTAWLAIRDHQQIEVKPVAPILRDYLT